MPYPTCLPVKPSKNILIHSTIPFQSTICSLIPDINASIATTCCPRAKPSPSGTYIITINTFAYPLNPAIDPSPYRHGHYLKRPVIGQSSIQPCLRLLPPASRPTHSHHRR